MESKKDILKTVTRYAQAGDWVKVIKEYNKLIQMDPNDISIYNSMADALVKLDEHRKAFEFYLKVLEDYKARGNTMKMPFLYKKIAKLNPRKFDLEGKALHEKISKIVMAVSYFDREDYTRAYPALQEAGRLDDKNPEIQAKLGDTAEKLMHIGDASEAYSKAIKLYQGKEMINEALEIARKVIKIDKTNVEAAAMVAEELIRKNKKDEAEDMFRDIFITLAEKNKVQQGIEVSRRAVKLDIKYGKQFYAYFLFKDDNIDEAKKILEESYSLSPEEKVLLGKIYYRTGEYEKAKNTLLSLDPEIINENEEILEQVGDVFLKLREDKKASEFYLKACRLLKEKSAFDGAITMAHKVQNVDKDNLELYEMMVDVYAKKNMKNQLIDCYERMAKIHDSAGRPEQAHQMRNMLQKLKML